MNPPDTRRTGGRAADGPPNCRGAGESRGHDLFPPLSLSLSLSLSQEGEKIIPFAQVAPARRRF